MCLPEGERVEGEEEADADAESSEDETESADEAGSEEAIVDGFKEDVEDKSEERVNPVG
jgi:hypothetical protein